MSDLSPQGQGGLYLLGASISPFDPKATSSVVGLRAVLLYLLAQFGMGRVSATQVLGAENRQRWSLGHDRPLK